MKKLYNYCNEWHEFDIPQYIGYLPPNEDIFCKYPPTSICYQPLNYHCQLNFWPRYLLDPLQIRDGGVGVTVVCNGLQQSPLTIRTKILKKLNIKKLNIKNSWMIPEHNMLKWCTLLLSTIMQNIRSDSDKMSKKNSCQTTFFTLFTPNIMQSFRKN